MKRFYQVYNLAFSVILLLLGGLAIFLPQREYSENENRYLDKMPKWQLAEAVSGDYQKNVSDAMEDQFPARDFWMKLSTVGEKVIGYKDIGGVYLGHDGYYITKTLDSDISLPRYIRNLRYTEYFAAKLKSSPVVLLVPPEGTVLEENLPRYGTVFRTEPLYETAGLLLEKAQFLDIRENIERNRYKQLYYRTDHHWTLSGAFAAYEAYCGQKKMEARPYAEFIPKKMTDDFYGTLYSKTLDPAAVPDEIYAPHGALWEQAVMTIDDGKEETPIYDESKLKEKDKYAYFFGGNYGKVTIKTGSAKGKGKKLLVIKDSFANSFVPFLMDDYQTITMIDLRYYRDSIQKLAKKEKYTDVLILYELSNFAGERNIYRLTQ